MSASHSSNEFINIGVHKSLSVGIPGNIVSIEADIGAGKSTFLRLLNTYYPEHFNVIYEPLEDWLRKPDGTDKNILGLLYEDSNRWAYTFQHNAYITRIMKVEKEYNPNKINVCERSTESDHQVFAKMLRDDKAINEIEYDIYLNWTKFLSNKHQFFPSRMIYLRTDPSTAYTRLQKRNRTEESSVSLEYLTKVNQYHEKWLNGRDDVIVLDGNIDFEKNLDKFHEMVRTVFPNIAVRE